MVKPYNLEDMNFADIEQIIMEKIRPKKKLIIAERAHFMQTQPTARRVYQRLCTTSPEGCTVLRI